MGRPGAPKKVRHVGSQCSMRSDSSAVGGPVDASARTPPPLRQRCRCGPHGRCENIGAPDHAPCATPMADPSARPAQCSSVTCSIRGCAAPARQRSRRPRHHRVRRRPAALTAWPSHRANQTRGPHPRRPVGRRLRCAFDCAYRSQQCGSRAGCLRRAPPIDRPVPKTVHSGPPAGADGLTHNRSH